MVPSLGRACTAKNNAVHQVFNLEHHPHSNAQKPFSTPGIKKYGSASLC